MGENGHHTHEHEHDEGLGKVDIILFISGGVLFAVSYLVRALSLPVLPVILMVISYLFIAHKIILNTVHSFGVFDENFLMLVASAGAMIIGEYFEAFAVVALYEIGEYLEDLSVDNARKSVKSLVDVKSDTARVIIGDDEVMTPANSVKIGDVIRLRPGERVPLDGVVLSGRCTLDTSAITGESLPREADVGEEVFSGAINLDGVVDITVTKPLADSTATRILRLVEESEENRAKPEKFITKFARIYTPVVVGAAVMLALIGGAVTGGWYEWVHRALTFLVVSCPCALVISVPLCYFAAIGSGAKRGILIKGGNHLDALCAAKTVLFDKTGTLTTGRFEVVGLIPEKGIDKEMLLKIAAAVESRSNHPLARSICDACGDVSLPDVSDYDERSALGVSCIIAGKRFYAGSARFMAECGINVREYDYAAVYIAVNGRLLGTVLLSDTIKDDSKIVVNELKEAGIERMIMLTGDNEAAARRVAEELDIDYRAALMPEDKLSIVGAYDSCVFVGDGINDAPSLVAASVGVAMGGIGSDSAIEAADMVIMNDKPGLVAAAMMLAKRTRFTVKMNIVFALCVKLIILVLAAVGIAPMWAAVFGDVGVALICVLNAMRLLKC